MTPVAIYAHNAILIDMNIFAHNGIDHIHHAHESAAHASEPNYLLIITLFAALFAGAIFLVTRLTAKTQSERVHTQRKKRK